MIDNNITKSIANAYVKMYEAKAVKREAWVPAEITDEGVADFMGAAADAAKKGDETFKFGDKTYKVTMKKATADKINEAKKLRPTDKVSIVGRGPGQLDISAHIRKLFKLKDMDVYFDDADLVIKDKTAVQGALRNNSMTIADLEDAVRKSGLVKEEVEESLQEAKTLKPNDKVSVVGRGMGQTDVSAHIRKTFKLKDMDAYFDGVDLVVKNKTAVKGALKDPRMTIADLEAAVRKSGLVKEVAEPEAQGEKDFKDMHTNNTKKSGEKDDGTVVKETTDIDEISSTTIANYIKKSGKDSNTQINRAKKAQGSGDLEKAKDASRRFGSRMKGQARAIDKLVNKNADAGANKRIKRSPDYSS